MNEKGLMKLINRYRSYKRFIKSHSLAESFQKLERSSKYGFQRTILESEVKFWNLITKVDEVVQMLPKKERKFMFAVLGVNTYEKASVTQIAKEMGISTYKVKQYLDKMLHEINKNRVI